MERNGFSEESLREIAEQKVSRRFIFKVHFAFYFLVNALLVVINLLTLWYYYWFIFPLFSWLIALILHGVAYYMYATGVYPMAKRWVIMHFFSWFSVSLLLFVIDFDLASHFIFHRLEWAYYAVVPWFIVFLVHFIVYYVYYSGDLEDGEGKSRKEKAIEEEMKKMQRKIGNY